MSQDERIAVLETEIVTLKSAIIALAYLVEANALGAFDQPEPQNIEVLH